MDDFAVPLLELGDFTCIFNEELGESKMLLSLSWGMVIVNVVGDGVNKTRARDKALKIFLVYV